MAVRVLQGDCRQMLATLEPESVQCVVTSPPYFGLRDYGCAGQIGLEPSPAEHVQALVEAFREVRRVLRPDGTAWLNLGDSYASDTKGSGGTGKSGLRKDGRDEQSRLRSADLSLSHQRFEPRRVSHGLKHKDLLMIPARAAIALQEDGWHLRSDIIWHKLNPMPESVRDRPTSAHEHVFLLTRSPTYHFDMDAVREPFADDRMGKDGGRAASLRDRGGRSDGFTKPNGIDPSANGGRNLRNVWSLASEPFSAAGLGVDGVDHFAVMPASLAEICIKAGSRPGDTVLDPFAGAFTVPLVADRLQRHAVGIELSPAYCDLARARLIGDAPLLAEVA